MSTCPACFLVRSATGACDCEESLPNMSAVLERPIAPPEAVTDPCGLVADGNLANVWRVARALMDHHGLEQVKLEWNNSKRRIGTTWSNIAGPYLIALSRPLFEHMSPEQRLNTITHEIAHALVGHRHGHDYVWQQKHRELGGDGKRCTELDFGDEAEAKIYKWTGVCPGGHKTHRSAKSQKMFKMSCSRCLPYYSEQHKFSWTQNF